MAAADKGADSREWKGAALAGLAGGAGVAAGFALGEAALGALQGQALPFRWWLRLGLAYGLVLAPAGAAAALAATRLRRPPAPAAAPAVLLHFWLCLYLGTVVLQVARPGHPLGSPPRLASLAAGLLVIAASLVRMDQPPLRPRWLATPWLAFLVPGCVQLGLEAVPGGVPAATAALAGPVLAIHLAGAAWRRHPQATTAAATASMALAVAAVGCPSRLPAAGRYWTAAPQPPVPPAANTANVVLIVLDTLRARSLALYGYPRRTTPHLDAWAREATTYTRFHATSSWTLPTHASLFTGLYPSRHGVRRPPLPPWRPGARCPPLAAETPTLAGLLAARGFATMGVAANFTLATTTGLARGFREYDARPEQAAPTLLARVLPRLPPLRLLRPPREWTATAFSPARDVRERAEAWLRARPAGQPYFLFVNFLEAHAPYPSRGRADDYRAPGVTGYRLREADVDDLLAQRRPLAAAESAALNDAYDRAASALDEELGALLATLRARPDYDQTWVVVTADHGEALGEHGLLGHGLSLFEPEIAAPLIIRPPRPRGSAAGALDPSPVQSVDILPTLLEGLAMEPPPGLDGVPAGTRKGPMFAELCVPPLAERHPRFRRDLAAVIDGPWKYIEDSGGQGQLFHLEDDPGEATDAAAGQPEVLSRLRGELAAWRREQAQKGLARGRAPDAMDERQVEDLRALGYVR